MDTDSPLQITWCDRAAATFAVAHWHYSRRMPSSKLAKLGVWERGRFVGVVVFGKGATPMLARPFGLRQVEVAELVRVALRDHGTPTSRIITIATKMLHRAQPGLRLLVSFADTAQGHHGGIYQAAGWTYLGADVQHVYRVRGELVHPRTCYDRWGAGGQSIPWLRAHVDPDACRVVTPAKHKYALALDRGLRPALAARAQAYPKRVGGVASSTGGRQLPGDGASPISTLRPPVGEEVADAALA